MHDRPDRSRHEAAAHCDADIGAVAAGLLLDRSWIGQEDVAVLGPEALSYADIATIVSAVVGREVRYRQVPFDEFRAQLVARGLTAAFAQGYVDMLRAKDEGMDTASPRSAAIIGRTSFRQWAEAVLKPAVLG